MRTSAGKGTVKREFQTTKIAAECYLKPEDFQALTSRAYPLRIGKKSNSGTNNGQIRKIAIRLFGIYPMKTLFS